MVTEVKMGLFFYNVGVAIQSITLKMEYQRTQFQKLTTYNLMHVYCEKQQNQS